MIRLIRSVADCLCENKKTMFWLAAGAFALGLITGAGICGYCYYLMHNIQ